MTKSSIHVGIISKDVRPKMANIKLDWAEFIAPNALNGDSGFVVIAHFHFTSHPLPYLPNYHLYLVFPQLTKGNLSLALPPSCYHLLYLFLFLLFLSLPLLLFLFSREKNCNNTASDRPIARGRTFINFKEK